ncbi:MAG TPA: phosphopantetheine-binding protein, partial [Ktedonobacteraceae bacterium]|nr:phosphopantetheine-binding protein [Ktedonobacteraceae bacterium]
FQIEEPPAADMLIQQVLASGYAQTLDLYAHSSQDLPVLSQAPSEATSLLALGRLYTLGHNIHWSVLSPEGCQCVSLPTYPWQRKRLWLDWLNIEEISTPPESRYQEGLPQTSHPEEQTVSRLLETVSSNQRPQILLDHLKKELGSILEVEPITVQESQSFFGLGMDSLAATQLANRLQRSLELHLSPDIIFRYPSVERLGTYLTQEIQFRQRHKQESTPHPVPHSSIMLEELSEAQVEVMLISKLTMIEEILNERS